MLGGSFLLCKNLSDSYIILLLFTDDMLIAGTYKHETDKLKNESSKEFAMNDLGFAT